MLRFRRYRVFLLFAFFVTIALYHFTSVRDWERATAASVEGLKKYGLGTTTTITPAAALIVQTELQHSTSIPVSPSKVLYQSSSTRTPPPTTPTKEQAVKPPTTLSSALLITGTSTVSVEQLNAQKTLQETSTQAAVDLSKNPPTYDDDLSLEGQGRHEVAPLLPDKPIIHWISQDEHFPIPFESLIPLPSGVPVSIPKIQHAFKDESSNARIDRERRLDTIKEAFQFAWTGYKDRAWKQDELSPVSGKSRNPFCGWAATLVDSLDTLWILGMEDDFLQATLTVGEIDFTTSIRNDIPLFETTIRYLGGLISAYDLSEGKYKVLLDKAVQLANVLMGAFDTPNRMPITYYYWKPTFSSQPHRAGTRVVLAELGSLSMEFTRLAQITKEAKYYDAIARITNELEIWQRNTTIPGLWPKSVDASGCKKADKMPTTPREHSLLNGPAAAKASIIPTANIPLATPKTGSEKQSSGKGEAFTSEQDTLADGTLAKSKIQNWGGSAYTDAVGKVPVSHVASNEPTTQTRSEIVKRQLAMEKLSAEPTLGQIAGGNPVPQISTSGQDFVSSPPKTVPDSQSPISDKVDCEAQGLASPPKMGIEDFTFGGQADSTYEYLPKQHLLLGGLNKQYQRMYEKAIDAANKYLVFRPMLPDSRDILVLGSTYAGHDADAGRSLTLNPEQQHLLCFGGGMYAIGAKIFNRMADLDIAAKLTDGCVWAYESTTTGVMPEGFTMMPCDNKDACEWNQTRWYDALDPYGQFREQSTRSSRQAVLRASQEQTAADHPSVPIKALDSSGPEAVQATTSTSSSPALPTSGPLAKRQLGPTENDPPTAGPAVAHASDGSGGTSNADSIKPAVAPVPATATEAQPVDLAIATEPPPTREEFVQRKIKDERLPIGVPTITSRKYILRPEAIESVFIMYRVTGDEIWRERGWKMFNAIQNHTRVEFGNSAIRDVTHEEPGFLDEMESFWLAETLKYFYLLFSDPSVISLDDYVLNTEAHPFKRPK